MKSLTVPVPPTTTVPVLRSVLPASVPTSVNVSPTVNEGGTVLPVITLAPSAILSKIWKLN